MPFETLDIVLLLPIAYGLVQGFVRGFLSELAGLVGIVAGLVVSLRFGAVLSDNLIHYFPENPTIVLVLSYLSLFIAIFWLSKLTASLLRNIVRALALDPLNRLLGGLFGAVKWGFIVAALCYLTHYLQDSKPIFKPETLKASIVYQHLLEAMDLLLEFLALS